MKQRNWWDHPVRSGRTAAISIFAIDVLNRLPLGFIEIRALQAVLAGIGMGIFAHYAKMAADNRAPPMPGSLQGRRG